MNELHKVLVPPRGLFAAGKFDQYKRDIPYATLAQAFESLVRPLLTKSEAELSRWRDALRGGAGSERTAHRRIWFPSWSSSSENSHPFLNFRHKMRKRRFQLVFRRFIGVFARAGTSARACSSTTCNGSTRQRWI